MRGLEVVVVVGVLVLLCGVLGRRLHLPVPLVQLGLDVEEVRLDGAPDDD